MNVYVDTSVLLELLVDEPGSEAAGQVWRAADRLVAVRIGYAEARAALAAAARADRIRRSQLRRLKVELNALWEQLAIVEITEDLLALAGELAETEALRGYDAVHLASAVVASVDVVATADTQLSQAASRRGMHVAYAR